MELGVLNKIDRELNNSGKQNNGFSNNFFYNTPKEYKASTLDWLAGQARI